MTKWEYKIVKIMMTRYVQSDLKTDEVEQALNNLGKEGWEVVNIFDLNMKDGKSSYVIASLKRPLQ